MQTRNPRERNPIKVKEKPGPEPISPDEVKTFRTDAKKTGYPADQNGRPQIVD